MGRRPSPPEGSRSLSVQTLVLLEERAPGCLVGAAVADLSLASLGGRSHVLTDLETFLGEHLAEAPAAVVAGFASPPEAELRLVEVELERADLPARLRKRMRLAFPCVLLPLGRDLWARVPALGHTLFLPRKDDPDAALASEIARVVRALELGDDDWLALFPGAAHELVRLEVSLAADARDRALGHERRLEAHRRAEAEELLARIGVRVTVPAGDAPPLVGRDRELAELARLLTGRARVSVVLVGEASAGKSALVRAQCAAGRSAPSIYATSAAQLIAGMSGFGAWQEQVDKVMRAAELVDAVLYFENFAELLGEHPERGGMDALGIMRPFVVDGRVRVLGELTPEGLAAGQRHQVGLFSALARVEVKPLDRAAAVAALRAHLPRWSREEPGRASVDPDVVEPVVDLLDRYQPYRAFPGKAVRLVEELRAGRAAAPTAGDGRPRVSAEDAYDAFSAQTGVPAFLLRPDRELLRDQVIARFRRRLVGQEEAVRRVVDTLCVVKADLSPRGRPLATFLLVGPTGVGKTELARTLAEFLFGAPDRAIRFDMSEYADPLAADRLIRGSERDGGLLTSRVRAQPFCVLLLDEIEKAHPSVFDLLLQVLGEGRLSDARGRTTFFENAIVLMTSNLGAAHRRRAIGVATSDEDPASPYLQAAADCFRPEFLGRVDRIVPFSPLTPEEVRQVTRIAVARIADRRGFQQSSAALEVSEAALALLAAGGLSESYGVRALRRHLDDELCAPAAALLASLGPDAQGALLWVGAGEDAPPLSPGSRLASLRRGPLCFEVHRRPQAAGRRALRGMSAVSEARRQVDALMAMDQAEWVRDQLSFLRSQLAGAAAGSANLLGEHHRLERILRAAEDAGAELCAIEELALVALFAGEDARSLAAEAEEARLAFRRAFFYVATADREPRDQATLAVHAVDGGRVLELWLEPLLAAAEARGWELEAHPRRAGEPAAPRGWSAGRGFGPGWIRERIAGGDLPSSLLLRVRGKDAGLCLGMEDGPHRFKGYASDGKDRHLVLQLMAMRTDLSDEEWLSPAMVAPPPPPPRPGHDATRERTRGAGEVVVHRIRRVEVDDADYWERFEEIALEDYLFHDQRGNVDEVYVGLLDRGGGEDEEEES